MPPLPSQTDYIVKKPSPLYDPTGAENTTPAIKNRPNRKVGLVFMKKLYLIKNIFEKRVPLYDWVCF
jgi:hypothetical protein